MGDQNHVGSITSGQPGTTGRRAAVDLLDRLGKALTVYGFAYEAVCPKGAAVYARITNKAVPQLKESIACYPPTIGEWWFWWSWGERIAPVSDFSDVVRKVIYVLSPPTP
jgi:hypothetical protein